MQSSSIEDSCICEICTDWFDSEKKIPRILQCGHTFCQSCLENPKWNNRSTCAICRRQIRNFSYNINDIPINYALKNVAEKMRNNSVDDVCEVHQSLKNWECVSCKLMMCGTCGLLSHKHCKVNFIDQTLAKAKNDLINAVSEVEAIVEEQINLYEKSSKQLVKDDQRLEEEVKKLEQQLQAKKQEAQNVKVNLSNKILKLANKATIMTKMKSTKKKTLSSTFYSMFETNKTLLLNICNEFKQKYNLGGLNSNFKNTGSSDSDIGSSIMEEIQSVNFSSIKITQRDYQSARTSGWIMD